MTSVHAPLDHERPMQRLECDDGYVVCRRAVRDDVRTAALRRLNLEITRSGLAAAEIKHGIQSTFFPHVRWEPEVLVLQDAASVLVGLIVWPGSHRGCTSSPQHVELNAGDAVVMHPKLAHCSGLNRGGAVRYAAYFRLLAAEGESAVHAGFTGTA